MYIVKRGQRLSFKNKRVLLNELIIVEGGGSIDMYNCVFESNGNGGIIILGDYGDTNNDEHDFVKDFDNLDFDRKYPSNSDNNFIDNNIIVNCEFVNFTQNNVISLYGLDRFNTFENISLIDCNYGIKIVSGDFVMKKMVLQIESKNSHLLEVENFTGDILGISFLNKNIENKGSFIFSKNSSFQISKMNVIYDKEYDNGNISEFISGEPIKINNSTIKINGYDFFEDTYFLPHLIVKDGEEFVIDTDMINMTGFIIVEGGGRLISKSENITTVFGDNGFCGVIILGKPINEDDKEIFGVEQYINEGILPEFNREYSRSGNGNNILKNISFVKMGVHNKIAGVNFVGLGKDNLLENIDIIDSYQNDLLLLHGNCEIKNLILSEPINHYLLIKDHYGKIDNLIFNMSKSDININIDDNHKSLIRTEFISRKNITKITNCSLSDNTINGPIGFGDLSKYHHNKLDLFDIDFGNTLWINGFQYTDTSCILPHNIIRKGETLKYENEIVILKGYLILENGSNFYAKNTCFISEKNNYGGIIFLGNSNKINFENQDFIRNKFIDLEINFNEGNNGKIVIDNSILIGLGHHNMGSIMMFGLDDKVIIKRLMILKSMSDGIKLVNSNVNINKSYVSDCKKNYLNLEQDHSIINLLMRDDDSHKNPLIHSLNSKTKIDMIYEKDMKEYIKGDISIYREINNGYVFNILESNIELNSIHNNEPTNLLGIKKNIIQDTIKKIGSNKNIKIIMDDSKDKMTKSARKLVFPTIGNAMLKVAGKKLFSYEKFSDTKKVYKKMKK